MRILIIGSRGFIGSHLTDHFSNKKENEVFGCDVSDEASQNYFKVNKFSPDYNDLFKDHRFDICIYAGGNGSVPYSLENPDIDFQLNTHTVNSILSCISKYQPDCKFLHMSSAAVYGSPSTLPINEQAPIKPISPYGWHKYLSEIICRKYYSLYKIKTISLRVFAVYGERLTKQLFWDIYLKIQKSDEITLFGTGNESRDFINIRDLMHAIELVIEKGDFNGETYNVSSGTETTINQAAHEFCRAYNDKVKVTFSGQTKAGDPINWRADISRLASLGFKSKISLTEGLENYTKWLKEKE
ncbi:MAG: NAD-dependent epimerase/dehydratase family protein [Bacteroidota bacterium]